MPYKSRKQEEFFNANRAKLEAQGVNVDEWNKASKGMKLPERAKPQQPKPSSSSQQKSVRSKQGRRK